MNEPSVNQMILNINSRMHFFFTKYLILVHNLI